MTMNDIEARVRAFLAENFPTDPGAAPLHADTSLFEAGLIDSMGVLTVVTWIEETFGVVVDDDEVVPENIDGIARLSRYIGGKLAAAGGA
jgi:acyl carrier protein